MHQKRLLPLIITALCATQLLAVTRYETNITDAESRAIADLPQFDSKARIGGGGSSGSAALLSPEWAITASHVVSDQEGLSVTIYYKSQGIEYSKTGTTVAAYSGYGGLDDMMLVQLDTPITEPVSYLAPYNGFDEYDQMGWFIGAGRYGSATLPGEDLNPLDGNHRGMTQRLYSVQAESALGAGGSVTQQLMYFLKEGDPTTSTDPRTTRYEAGPAPGDSGAPTYLYSRGRFYHASVHWGVFIGRGFYNTRTSTHLDSIQTESGLEFAYPKNLTPEAVWVAEDLASSLSNLSTVSSWADRLDTLTFSNATDGGTGAPVFVENGTPTGLASVRFDGNDALGLSALENPFAGETAMSIVMVVKPNAVGAGLEVNDFDTAGLLDATAGSPNGWSLSYAANGRIGWSLDDSLNSADPVESQFRGGVGNGSLNDGNWHVVVATWDGSEISSDNAGDDQNMKLFVDSINQSKRTQGPSYINVGRDAVALLLGDSQTNAQAGFNGEIAEVRLYSGELELHEVDRLLTALREQYVSGTPGVVFERPWTDVIEVAAGQSLKLRGSLTGGANSVTWDAFAGPGAVTFSDINAVNTDVSFQTPGTYQLRATADNGVTTGSTDLWIDVYAAGAESSDATEYNVLGNWLDSRIGGSVSSATLSESGSQITLAAAADGLAVGIGETYDHGMLAWKGVAGDFDLVTRLDSLTATAASRAGIMVRGGTGPSDATAFIGLSSSGGIYWLTRQEGGYWGELTEQTSPTLSFPSYLKLERRGATLTAYTSADGVTYTPFGTSADVALPGVAKVGFFVTSGDSAATATAVFDQHSLKQVGYAQGSSIQIAANNSTDGYAEYDPVVSGSDESWIHLSQVSGPASLDYFKVNNDERQVFRALLPGPGAYRTRLFADDGNTMTFIDDEDCLDNNILFEFETDGNSEGWNPTNVTGFTVSGGVASGVTETDDPQLTQSGFLFDGSLDQVVVRMKVDQSGSVPVQLFWSRDGGAGFVGTRVVSATYTGANAFQDVVFDLSGEGEWVGRRITALRLDPVNGVGTAGAAFEIDSIEISDGSAAKPQTERAYYFNNDGNFENWTPTKHLDGQYVLDGLLTASTTGIDPILVNDVRDFDSNTVESLIVRIKSTQSGDLQFFWSTTDTPTFAAARQVVASVNGDGNWQTLRLPLSGNAEWDGKTIASIRLDPINKNGADIEIDTVVLSDGDADDDGMPDLYEDANSLDLLVDDSTSDHDSDGYSNGDEYVAGTAPNDASDRFTLTNQTHTGAAFQVVLPGKAGRVYSLGRKLNLTDPAWTPVDNEPVLGSDTSVMLEDTSSFDKAFYRVEVIIP